MVSEAVVGQSLGAKLGGSHRSKGQTKSSKSLPGRRGVDGNQNQGSWTTVVATNHHKRWWCATELLRAGQTFALQPTSRGNLVHVKKSQNYETYGNLKFRW